MASLNWEGIPACWHRAAEMAGEFSLEIGSDIFPEPGEGIQDPTYLHLREFHNAGGLWILQESQPPSGLRQDKGF